jgi:tetratricopeptide (TPR) repeat protein
MCERSNSPPRRETRLPFSLVLGLGLATGFFGGRSAAAQSAPSAPVTKGLSPADSKRIEELQKSIEQCERSGRYEEGADLTREIVTIREAAMGAEHRETADARRTVTTLRMVAALPEAGRKALVATWALTDRAQAAESRGRHADAEAERRQVLEIHRQWLGADDLTTAGSGLYLAENLRAQGKYAQAEPLYQQALATCLAVVGENHPYTGMCYNDIALNLSGQGKYAAAEPLCRKALGISLKVFGEDHLETATNYDTLAANLNHQGKYAAAEPLYQKALAIHRKLLGEDHPDSAVLYNNAAANLAYQGKYAAAEPLVRKSLALDEKALGKDHPRTAVGYGNLASNLGAQGRYADAQALYETALSIFVKALGEDHPQTAQGYNNLALSLKAQGKHAEADPLFRRALAIRRKVLGENHPSTAASYSNLAFNLKEQGKYAEAEPLYQKALAIRLEVLGENHPDTATSYNNLAANMKAQGKLAAADELYRRALAITVNAVGENHPDTARIYNNIAQVLHDQGKYVDAEPLHRKGLTIRLQVLGENHPDTATSYGSLASVLVDQGKYAAAEPLIQRALAIRLRVLGLNHPDTGLSYNNLALALSSQGKYSAAEPFFQKSLAIQLKSLGADHPGAAARYENIAINLSDQERYAEAEPLFETALAIRRKVLGEDHPDTARSYRNLASNLGFLGKNTEADALFERAAAIDVKMLGEDNPSTALDYCCRGINLEFQGKYAAAEPLYRKALAIALKGQGADNLHTARVYHYLALDLDNQGRLPTAIENWTAAAAIAERTRHGRGASGLERAMGTESPEYLAAQHLALALARQGQPAHAWTRWESSLARGVLDDFSSQRLRPLKPEERQRESDLRGQLQQLEEQIGRLAASPGRSAAEDRQLDELRESHGETRGRLTELENELDQRYGTFAGRPAGLDEIRKALPDDAALVGWVDRRALGETYPSTRPWHWACVLRKHGDPIWIQIQGTGADGARTREDADRAETLRTALQENRPTWRDIAATMARQRLEPLRAHLQGVRRLMVLPSSALAGVPIEALVAAWPQQREELVVSYVPSGSMLTRLQTPGGNRGVAGPAKLLALGDPAYPPPERQSPAAKPPDEGIAITAVLPNSTAEVFGIKPGDVLLDYDGTPLHSPADLKTIPAETGARSVPVKFWRNGEVRTVEVSAGVLGIRFDLKQPAADIILAQRAADDALKPAGRGDGLARLPGTRREVETIAALFPSGQVTTLLGADATERALQARARSGELKGYRFLHFAAHGRSNPKVAMSSALILAPEPGRLNPADAAELETDGELTAEQVVQTWDLDADLVVLSACETGLGQYANGEGYLGFAQALLVKGARSVVLSQWKVPDQATTLLMTRFYANLLGRRAGLAHGVPKAEALQEARSWLRRLSAPEAESEMKRLGLDPAGASRGERKAAPSATGTTRPFEHPYYWAGFILIGNPD